MASVSPLVPDTSYAKLADDASIQRAVDSLQAKKVNVIVVDNAAAAKAAVLSMLPEGAQVFTNTSRTLESTGLLAAVDAGEKGLVSLKKQLFSMDRYVES
jgi:hypothetical protein